LCIHLLAEINVTFGTLGDGAFCELASRAIETLEEAVNKAIEAERTVKQNEAITSLRFATLTQEVRDQIGKSPGPISLRSCGGALFTYLCDLFGDIPKVVETSFDRKSGPGVSSTYRRYWVRRAKVVATTVLERIKDEAQALDRAAPSIPRNVEIGMVESVPIDDCDGDWPTVDYPKRFPRSAKLVATLGVASAPGNSWEDRYYISGNRGRSHWILWIVFEDPYNSRVRRHPVAWCKVDGVSEHDGSLVLLREWLCKKRDEWSEDDYEDVSECGVLSEKEIAVLRSEVWPGE